MSKLCTKCNKEGIFYNHRSICKDCDNFRRREFYKNHKESDRASNKLWLESHPEKKGLYQSTARFKRYHISKEMYQCMLEQQHNLCMACGEELDLGKNTHIDHDHNCCPKIRESCGECIRGVICARCNLVLGKIKDSENTLLNILMYLRGFQHVY